MFHKILPLFGFDKRVILLIGLIYSSGAFLQCPDGAIGVSGAGCGCLSGCNLTSFGGPNCGGGTSGNCSAGQVSMQVDIPVPDGCTFTVTAVIMNRPGCSASGGDGGDQLKVDVPGGPKAFQTGASNATLMDSYTIAGPATIRVSGSANRADEIITYSTTYSGAFCDACGSILPISLVSFNAILKDNIVELEWETSSEINSDYYEIERSIDGTNFEVVLKMDALGNSSSLHNYKVYDSSPPKVKLIYYRLKQIDTNGDFTYSRTTVVDQNASLVTFRNNAFWFDVSGYSELNYLVNIYNLQGSLMMSSYVDRNNNYLDWNYGGIFIITIPEIRVTEKLTTF